MKEKLSYRFPGKEILHLEGSFVPLSTIDSFEGFIISNFEGTTFYTFQEDKNQTHRAIGQKVPYIIQEKEYLNQAAAFIEEMNDQKIEKAVFSRIKEVPVVDFSAQDLFKKLTKTYPNTFCYCIESQFIGNWIGASPETLIELNRTKGFTVSLAGTKKHTDKKKWGTKELEEQHYVTNAIHEVLARFASNIEMSEKKEFSAGPVKHLVNYFSFELNSTQLPELLRELHPTPAVSGFPTKKSIELIHMFEKHDRRFYTGMIGLIGRSSSQLFVNIRCCQLIENSLYLYLGGGFTKDSTPKNEWLETENKASTILNLV